MLKLQKIQDRYRDEMGVWNGGVLDEWSDVSGDEEDRIKEEKSEEEHKPADEEQRKHGALGLSFNEGSVFLAKHKAGDTFDEMIDRLGYRRAVEDNMERLGYQKLLGNLKERFGLK